MGRNENKYTPPPPIFFVRVYHKGDTYPPTHPYLYVIFEWSFSVLRLVIHTVEKMLLLIINSTEPSVLMTLVEFESSFLLAARYLWGLLAMIGYRKIYAKLHFIWTESCNTVFMTTQSSLVTRESKSKDRSLYRQKINSVGKVSETPKMRV